MSLRVQVEEEGEEEEEAEEENERGRELKRHMRLKGFLVPRVDDSTAKGPVEPQHGEEMSNDILHTNKEALSFSYVAQPVAKKTTSKKKQQQKTQKATALIKRHRS